MKLVVSCSFQGKKLLPYIAGLVMPLSNKQLHHSVPGRLDDGEHRIFCKQGPRLLPFIGVDFPDDPDGELEEIWQRLGH